MYTKFGGSSSGEYSCIDVSHSYDTSISLQMKALARKRTLPKRWLSSFWVIYNNELFVCMYVLVCMYVQCMYIQCKCVYVRMYVYLYVCLYVCMYVEDLKIIYVWTVCMHMYSIACMYVLKCMYVCMYVCDGI